MVALVGILLVASDRNPTRVSSNRKRSQLLLVTSGFGGLKHSLHSLIFFPYTQKLGLYLRKVCPTNKQEKPWGKL